MRVNKKLLVSGILVAGLAIAGGSAFTDSNSAPAAETLGYNAVTVSGGTIDSLTYTTDTADPPDLTSITIVTAGSATPQVSVNVEETDSGTTGWFTCNTPTADGANESYSCTVPGATGVPVSEVTGTNVLINSVPPS